MIRTLTALAIAAAVASPAAAAVKINIAGKDAATVKAMVARAAETTCRDELQGSVLAFRLQATCVEAAKKDAFKTLAAAQPTAFAAAATPARN